MKHNKFWVLLIVLVLSIGLVSGCSQAELEFIDLMGQMNDMELYESQETVNLSMSLGSALSQENPAEIAVLEALLAKYTLVSNTRIDANNQVWDGTFSVVDKDSGTKTELGSFVGSNDTLYLQVDKMISLIKTFENPELNESLASFADVKYISINSSEMAKLMDPTGKIESFNIFDVEKQQALYKSLREGITQEAYDGYTTGMVEGSDNSYTLTVDKQAVLDNIEPFLVYSINNVEKIGDFSKGFLADLDAEELALMSLNTTMRDEAVQGMDTLTAEVAANRDQYLAQTGSIAATAKEGAKFVGDDTGITIIAEKVDDNNFKQVADMVIDFTPPEDPGSGFSMEMESQAEIKAIEAFSVEVPTSGIMTLTEVEKLMPSVLTIDTANNQYFFSQGFSFSTDSVEVRLENGRTYLPVRTVGEAMNETVGWDSEIQSAYILKDGEQINLKGNIYNGRAFVQIRDFEQLGYTVSWDRATKIATLAQ